MDLPTRAHDFEGWIRFLSHQEGGRVTTPRPGYRPDFRYRDQVDESNWCIWPLEYFTSEGDVPPHSHTPLECYGRFWILSEELAASYHKGKLEVGVEFYLLEGYRKIAEGTVTKLVRIKEV